MRRHILSVLALTLVFGAAGAYGAPAAEKKSAAQVMTPAERVAAARLAVAALPGKALQDWMTVGAFRRWNDTFGPLMRSDGSAPFVEDFFAHSLLLKGPQTAQSGIYAFYNPLQDNFFLFQTDNVDRVPRIEDFVFMTGGRFRGETLKKGENPQAIAPVKGGLDRILMQNTAAVTAKFRECFPETAKNFTLAAFARDNEPEQVCANAALRFALLRRFIKAEAKPDALKAGEIALLLWKGEKKALEGYFAFPAGDVYPAGVYSALPARVKQGMLPVLYFRNPKQGMLLGFASRVLPEMLVLIQIPPQGKPFFVCLFLSEKFVCNTR